MTTTPGTPTADKPSTTRSPGRYWLDLALETNDPHSMVGAAVTGLLAVLVERDEEQLEATAAADDYAELRREYDELEREADRRQKVIDDILEVCRKSRGQLAEKVRGVVDAAFPVQDPGAPEGEQPDGQTGADEGTPAA